MELSKWQIWRIAERLANGYGPKGVAEVLGRSVRDAKNAIAQACDAAGTTGPLGLALEFVAKGAMPRNNFLVMRASVLPLELAAAERQFLDALLHPDTREQLAVASQQTMEGQLLRTLLRKLNASDPMHLAVLYYASQASRHLFTVMTPRERQIVEYVGRGFTNEKISETIGVSPNTVKTFMKHLFKLCNVANRAELTALYVLLLTDEERQQLRQHFGVVVL